jgi:cobalt-zinc-cadmium efflux system membrane fusion protein
MVHVSAPVAGRITKIGVLEGQRVHAGDVLATIYSTRLSEAQAAFLKSWSQQQLEKRAVDRAETLLKADVIGSAELLRRRGELDQSNAELSAARSELQILGMPEPAIARLSSTGAMDASANITATISGTVLERKVTLGQIVASAETVFEIADLSNVWLVADVPEEASGNLRVGNIVEANATAFPDVRIRGKLAFVSSIVNPQTRTVQVRMDLPNPNHKYKPDMLATMKLETPAVQKQVIPLSAIVRNGDDDAVFVRTGENSFLLTPVKLGEQTGNERVLVDGVAPHKQIVLDGAFSLNNERLRLAQTGDR